VSSRELRQQIDAALAGVEGDTRPVRALCLELGRRLNHADQDRAALTHDLLAESTHSAGLAERVKVLEDQAAAARERLTRQSAQLAALEGEITALKEHLFPLVIVGIVECKANGKTYRLNPDAAADEMVRLARAGVPASVYTIVYNCDTWEDAQEVQAHWDALGLSQKFLPERPPGPPGPPPAGPDTDASAD
jgi:hypothetical protein